MGLRNWHEDDYEDGYEELLPDVEKGRALGNLDVNCLLERKRRLYIFLIPWVNTVGTEEGRQPSMEAYSMESFRVLSLFGLSVLRQRFGSYRRMATFLSR